MVWGPLMVGGTFLAATGTIPPWVLLASVPYALIVTAVLFGKHIDKIAADTKLGVRTLPVILGEARARTVGAWLMILFYPLTVLIVAVGLVGPWVLLIALGIPRLLSVLKVFDQPKPNGPPPGYPERGWPLWFVGYAFIHTRRAGGLFTLGLLLNALIPITAALAVGPCPAAYAARSGGRTTFLKYQRPVRGTPDSTGGPRTFGLLAPRYGSGQAPERAPNRRSCVPRTPAGNYVGSPRANERPRAPSRLRPVAPAGGRGTRGSRAW